MVPAFAGTTMWSFHQSKLQTAKPRRNSAIPRRDAPGLCLIRPPMRAWGMPGAQCTRKRR